MQLEYEMSPRKAQTILSTLSFSDVQKSTALVDKAALRRQKMLDNLAEQRKAAVALVEGTEYVPTKTVWEKDEQGNDVKVEKPKRMKHWFYTNGGDEWFIQLRFANKPLEVQAGKPSIAVGNKENLVTTIDTLAKAVEAQELDALMAKVAEEKRKGFSKRT